MFPALKASGNKEGINLGSGFIQDCSWFIGVCIRNTSKHLVWEEQDCPREGQSSLLVTMLSEA